MAGQIRRLLRRKAVEDKTGLGRQSIYNRMNDGTFPRSISLGENARAVAWLESDVDDWIDRQIENSRRPKVA